MKHVEQALHRQLSSDDHHSIATLNDVTQDMLADLRLLTTRSQIDAYLAFYIVRYRSGDGDKFMREVVAGGADPRAWGRRNVFVHLEEPDERFCLHLDWASMEARFAEAGGTRWWQARPVPASDVNQALHWSGWGAVGVRIDDVPYWWRHPKATMDSDCADDTGALVEHLDDASARLALRRWIALRLSWWARRYLEEAGTAVVDNGLLAAVGGVRQELTTDAAVAIRALVKEATLPYDPERDVRGFMGPDTWYTDGAR